MAYGEMVCKGCGGTKNIPFKRESRPIGDTGLEEMFIILQGDGDSKQFSHVYPPEDKAPKGYVPAYEYTTVNFAGNERRALRLFMRKVEGGAVATVDEGLQGKSREQLAEMAVMRGVTDAKPEWSKAKLIAAIEGAKPVAAGV